MRTLWDFLFSLPRWLAKQKFFTKVTLRTPVVSVGNVSMGGTGKTPFVCALIEKLRRDGKRVVVVSRSYRAGISEPSRVEPSLPKAAALFGDEPTMIARYFPDVPVYVAKVKYRAAQLAERQEKPDIIIVDDGFQHWRLDRNLDIVLLDLADSRANHVFPFGSLREPLGPALAAADVLFISKTQLDGEKIAPTIAANAATLQRSVILPREVFSAPTVGVFCGIGNSEFFYHEINEALGRGNARASLSFRKSFPDHHAYTLEDMADLQGWLDADSGRILVTTEKDWTKCASLFADQGQVFVVHTRVEIPPNPEFDKKLEALFHSIVFIFLFACSAASRFCF